MEQKELQWIYDQSEFRCLDNLKWLFIGNCWRATIKTINKLVKYNLQSSVESKNTFCADTVHDLELTTSQCGHCNYIIEWFKRRVKFIVRFPRNSFINPNGGDWGMDVNVRQTPIGIADIEAEVKNKL